MAFEENPVDEEEQILRLLERRATGERKPKGGKTENLRLSGPKGLRL